MVADKSNEPPEIPQFNETCITNKDTGREIAKSFYSIMIKQREFSANQQKVIDELKTKLKEATQDCEALKERNDNLVEENQKLKESEKNWEEVDGSNEELQTNVNRKLEALEKEYKKVFADCKTLESTVDQHVNNIKYLQSENKKLKEEALSTKMEYKKSQENELELLGEKISLEEANEKLRKIIEEKDDALSKLNGKATRIMNVAKT